MQRTGCTTHTGVIARLDRAIQYAAADVLLTDVAGHWMPAGACHRAALRADPVAGMTRRD